MTRAAWSDLFERAGDHDVTEAAVRDALTRRRESEAAGESRDDTTMSERPESPGPDSDPMARIVADADVLAADLLAGGPSREALDLLRAHDWLSLVASRPLLDDAEAVIADLAGAELAAAWRERVADLAVIVEHPEGDHPALASAMHGDARHLLSLDPDLGSVGAGVAIRREANVETSVRPPDAFVGLFDPASVYEALFEEPY